MQMSNDRENYCRLIGLNPNKETTYSLESIKSKIEAKRAKWEKESKDKQNDLDRRFTMSQYLDRVPDMIRIMSDAGLRSKEFEDARKLLKAKASKLNKDSVILHDGTRILLPGTADSLAKKLQWDTVTKDDLISAAKITKTSVTPPVGPKVANAFKGIREVGAYTPMDILNSLIENQSLQINVNPLREGSSLTEIRSAFDVCEKRVGNVKQDILPNQDSYIQSLRALKTVLDNDSEIAGLLKYGKCMKILAPAMANMDEDYGQPFTRDYIDNILSHYLKNTNADQAMAVSILEEYCVRKKYLANFSTKDSKLTMCPGCGGMTEMGANVLCCSICGYNIKTKCPNCGTEQSFGNTACVKCGFDFQGSLKKAKMLERRFLEDMAAGLIDKAAEDLDGLRRAYSTYPSLDELTLKLKSLTSKYDSAVRNIEQSYKLKKFRSCREYCDYYKKEFPYLMEKNVDIRQKYEDSVQRANDADALCAKAETETDEETRMNLYVSAAEKCPDHPVARSKMMQYPPESPADAVIQIREDKVLLKFAVPENRKGMTFCIYRGKDKLPAVDDETIPLTEIPNSVFLDGSVDPGVNYYYSIYSKRWGILSRESAGCGPATVFVEVENVAIEPVQGGLRIRYEKPKGCSKVRIWRKEGTTAAGTGDEIEIFHDGTIPLDDYGLKGGVKYNYLFVAEYETGGRTVRSAGTLFSGTTVKFPDPVMDMEIRWNKSDGSFTARWKTKEKVVLYSSPKKVTMYGRMVPISDLESWMAEIQPLELLDDGIRFMLPDGAIQYIYPMIPSGKVAVRGKDILVANLKPFRDVEKKISGNDCDITMDWPADAESAVITIKDDCAATGPNDITAERLTVSREAYGTDKMVRIPMGSNKKRVVTIFAVYDVDGEKMYSRGMSIDVYSGNYHKVSYTLRTDGKAVTAELFTDASVRSLPPMCAIRVTEGIPLKIWDGVSVWNSSGSMPLTGGKCAVSFPSPGLDLKKVRLFFVNEEDYHNYKFIHPLYKED